MKIEEGKFYRTRSGKKIGPLRFDGFVSLFVINGNPRAWHEDGTVFGLRIGDKDDDLVAEWADEPPIPPEPKAIDQMTLTDYRNGVASIWDSYRHC